MVFFSKASPPCGLRPVVPTLARSSIAVGGQGGVLSAGLSLSTARHCELSNETSGPRITHRTAFVSQSCDRARLLRALRATQKLWSGAYRMVPPGVRIQSWLVPPWHEKRLMAIFSPGSPFGTSKQSLCRVYERRDPG